MVGPVEAGDALDRVGRPAPAGQWKAERREALQCRLRQNAEAQKADAPLARLPGRQGAPDLLPLLSDIGRQVAVKRQNGERDVFLHHADNAVLDHPHDRDLGGQGRRVELVNACADGVNDLQPAESVEALGDAPRDEVANVVRLNGRRIIREDDVREIPRECLAEHGRAFRGRVEEEDGALVHAQSLSPSVKIIARHSSSSPRVMYSSGRWARAMSPGPQMMASKPASWKRPASVP